MVYIVIIRCDLKKLFHAYLKLARRNMQERSKGKPYGGKGKP